MVVVSGVQTLTACTITVMTGAGTGHPEEQPMHWTKIDSCSDYWHSVNASSGIPAVDTNGGVAEKIGCQAEVRDSIRVETGGEARETTSK